MKKRTMIFVVSLLFIQLISFGQQKKAKITFNNDVFRFGTVKEEAGDIDVQFTFTNTGTEDLTISRIKAEPGITIGSWPTGAIAPGASGVIKAVFNPKGSVDRISKRITVYSNASTSGKALFISGNIQPIPGSVSARFRKSFPNSSLRLKTNYASLGTITNKENKEKTIEIINTGAEDLALSFQKVPEHISVKALPKVLKPNQEGRIVITYHAANNKTSDGKQKWGAQTDRFYVVINDDIKTSTRNPISVRCSITEDFNNLTDQELANAPKIEFEELSFDFGTINQGDIVKHDFSFKNLGENDLEIRHIKAS